MSSTSNLSYNINFINLLISKSKANLQSEISRYYLNYLWWLIEPLLTIATFYIVFGIFLNRGTPNYIIFLITGLIPWQWFANTTNQAASSIINSKGLLLQVDIPKVFFPLEVFIRSTFKHFFVLIIVLIFLMSYGFLVSVSWSSLPILTAIQSLYIVGLGSLCASFVPFLPDLKFIISKGIRLAMFGSGIFFSIDDVVLPEHRFIMYMNPMAGLIKNYREILMYGRWPDWTYLGYLTLGGIALCALAFFVLHKLDHVYPRVCQQ